LAPTTNRWHIPPISKSTLDEWYDRIKDFPSLEVSREQFHTIWVNAQTVIETPFGILRFDPLMPEQYTQAHGYFWSPRVFANVEIFEEIIELLKRIGFVRSRTFGTDVYWEIRR